ncbi:MAG: histidine phosphatase family protein [Planctomycetaceae bacterium]|nr:histidine phosphatase family protein [Planctomycetaceae bacterium]
MSKSVGLLRHAKSSWSDSSLADHERPLNSRGLLAAPRMGEWLSRQPWLPDVVVCSTAARAAKTWELVSQQWRDAPGADFRAELYHASADELLTQIQNLPDVATNALFVGHNPGFENLLERWVNHADKFPTAAFALLELPISSWRDATWATQVALIVVQKAKELPA